MKITALYIALIALLLSTGCSYQKLDMKEVKVDKLIIQSDGVNLTQNQFNQQLLEFDVIYLGEIHDNPDHHRVQLEILKTLIDQGKKPLIGFEFFSREQTSWLLNYTSGSKSSFRPLKERGAEQMLRQRLGWQKREDWKFYFPMLELAKNEKLSVFGADIDTGIRSRMARAGIDQMLSIEKIGLPSTLAPDSDESQKLIFQDLRNGHCNMASEEWVQKLYKTMSIRNSFMAQSIQLMRSGKTEKQPIVMILGRGHVDYNAGVKAQLNFLDDTIRQLNIGLFETQDDHEGSYSSSLLEPANGFTRHDILILTPQRTEKKDDPCKGFTSKKKS